jgi:hypothetical protein
MERRCIRDKIFLSNSKRSALTSTDGDQESSIRNCGLAVIRYDLDVCNQIRRNLLTKRSSNGLGGYGMAINCMRYHKRIFTAGILAILRCITRLGLKRNIIIYIVRSHFVVVMRPVRGAFSQYQKKVCNCLRCYPPISKLRTLIITNNNYNPEFASSYFATRGVYAMNEYNSLRPKCYTDDILVLYADRSQVDSTPGHTGLIRRRDLETGDERSLFIMADSNMRHQFNFDQNYRTLLSPKVHTDDIYKRCTREHLVSIVNFILAVYPKDGLLCSDALVAVRDKLIGKITNRRFVVST